MRLSQSRHGRSVEISSSKRQESRSPPARLDRQEMAYGNQVLVTHGGTPYIRQPFDGVRMGWAGSNGFKLDAFSMKPALIKNAGSFNYASDHKKKLYGLYGNLPQSSELKVDLYAFVPETEQRALSGLPGKKIVTLSARGCSVDRISLIGPGI